jgi:hypothetical protein
MLRYFILDILFIDKYLYNIFTALLLMQGAYLTFYCRVTVFH